MHNCLSIPYDKLLKDGFATKQADVRGANSINTAFQLVAVIFQLQSLQQFGGVSSTHLDWTMVPYVRISYWKHYNNICDTIPFCSSIMIKPDNMNKKDFIETYIKNFGVDSNIYKGKHWWNFIKRYIAKKAMKRTVKELDQAVEGLFHNLNTLQSRSGNQLPFTSINYGTCTSTEGRMVAKSLIQGSINGVGKYNKTSIFPCAIFQYKKGVNDKPGTPNYDLFRMALKSTTKRIYPNYANCDWSNQIKWFEKDRQDKIKYLGSLSNEDYNTLKANLIGRPDLQKALGVDVNNTIKVYDKQQPDEIFSTMGKWNNAAHVKSFEPCLMGVYNIAA